MADSPGSTLSSHGSSEFTEDVKLEDTESAENMAPSSKRQKLGANSYRSTPLYDAQQEDQGTISDDSEGDAPILPTIAPALTDDEHIEQVTTCRWRACPAGDLGDMDKLVGHINDDHIGQRQKKYICEWEGCSRMDANHASGYALRAHMRSHTREKPFYCALPECDRSFTRSDALAKHMRTVHETEALRPSDPIPRNHSQAQVKPQRLKLIVNARPSNGEVSAASPAAEDISIAPSDQDNFDIPAGLQPTAEELALRPDQQYSLLRRQIYWSEKDTEVLKRDTDMLESVRKTEWQNNMLVLANLVEAELATAFTSETKEGDYKRIMKLKDYMLPLTMLPMSGTPWYRELGNNPPGTEAGQ